MPDHAMGKRIAMPLDRHIMAEHAWNLKAAVSTPLHQPPACHATFLHRRAARKFVSFCQASANATTHTPSLNPLHKRM
jgi:hypothetical protein